MKRALQMSKEQLDTPYQSLSLIKAGAGAGKTYHIQQTITQWVETGMVSANRILAVTFTNGAANEMKERIRLALMEKGLMNESKKLADSTISTIHGFGSELIHKYAFEQGISPKPKQLNEVEQKVLISLALSEVEAIVPLMTNLTNFGYSLKKIKDGWVDPAEVLRNDVLSVVQLLRNLSTQVDTERAKKILAEAQAAITDLYPCSPSSAESLNNVLWQSILAVRHKYQNKSVLNSEWSKSKSITKIIDNIYSATENKVSSDWGLWTSLQELKTAPKIINKKTNEFIHEDGQLAADIWQAADKLSVHPGPKDQQLKKVEVLINTAIEALKQYQHHKTQTGWIDFADMVSLAQQLMQNSQWQQEMKSCYDCLIIDEFQDTNPLQFALLWGFKQAGIPTLIVGDVKQSVMGFQGADSRLFNQLCQQYHEQTEELGGNWRSTPEVMEFVNQLGDSLFKDKYTPLIPKSGLTSELEAVSILNFSKANWAQTNNAKNPNYYEEGYLALAKEIKSLVASGKKITDKISGKKRTIHYADIAVLGRSHKELQSFSSALHQLNIQSKLTEQGWFESQDVSILLNALKYIANPRDSLAALTIKLMLGSDNSIEGILKDYAHQELAKRFTSVAIEQLDEVRKATKFTSVNDTVEKAIESLSLWHRPLVNDSSIDQRRANLLKLLSKAQEFEQLDQEVLAMQSIYGKSLSSFIVWLELNKDEFNELPHVEDSNENAVVLSTWHAAKGLEWPVVMVLSLEKPSGVRFDNFSIQYGTIESIDDMLNQAYPQIIGEFKDKTVKERFETKLMPDEKQTLVNLVYVAMTRAREQLILPWFDIDKDNSPLLLLSQLDLSAYPSKQVYTAETPVSLEQAQDKLFSTSKRRAFAFKQGSIENVVASQVSPSEIATSKFTESSKLTVTEDEISKVNYQSPLDLTALEILPADELGTLIHQCYQVMLTKGELAQRLFHANKVLAELPDMQQSISRHIGEFKNHVEKQWQAISFKTEVPFIAKNGVQVVSGIVDLLVEIPDGYYIVDHKTDRITDIERFNHHLPQLQAYQECLSLNKPILGIAINWVREGKILHYSEASTKF